MKKVWLFATYKWQGNPKALFLYMLKYCHPTHDCWWLCDNQQDRDSLYLIGIKNVLSQDSKKAKQLFAKADVYVCENFREYIPKELPDKCVIFNTWHGVGLKHIELCISEDSVISNQVMRKNIKNFKRYKNQTYMLVTSSEMESHFINETIIAKNNVIKGGYPRNIVYKTSEIKTYDPSEVLGLNNFNSIFLFCPTWRTSQVNGTLELLLPDLNKVEQVLRDKNNLLIMKLHPFMFNDPYYIDLQKKFSNSENILFWDDKFDIYEIFNLIDAAIVDYSSIFYDLLEAGVKKFVRYIPDYEDYIQSQDFTKDYFQYTDGKIVETFKDLISTLENEIPEIQNELFLIDYFFGYSKSADIASLIQHVDAINIQPNVYPELHSFDVFDTLIRRSTLAPYSIFAFMQKQILSSEHNFPQAFKDNWIEIRHKVEIDVRDMFRKTTFERGTDKIEINFDLIYERLQKNYLLSDAQIQYLKESELQTEIDHVEPIQSRIDYLFEQKNAGHDVILISDMYLPEPVIRNMLDKADQRLSSLPLYLSSSIGHQKSTGKLYKHIFFEKKYQYEKWLHYGDNAHADGVMPRKLGIETRVHQIDSFIPFESKMIQTAPNSYKYEAYQLATRMQRYRQKLLCENQEINNDELEKAYYAYAYAGSLLVPYVHWTILDALERGYETLYFISRDGHYLKLIADELILQNGYKIKSKFIYGSRKVWRLPSYIHDIDKEMFGPFGNFVGMDCFDDLVRASYLSEEDLLKLFPEFEALKSTRHLRGQVAENIRATLSKSQIYREKVLKIAAEKRVLVRQYIQENIDFSEKFAFVEFWGRGYTQDTFGRLLRDAAGKEVLNPFYYIRSFKPEDSINLRHNYVLAPVNFSFFEPLFASTPYASISEYTKNGDHIEAFIQPSLNEHYIYFEKGLIDFSKDYTGLDHDHSIDFTRVINEHSYSYQMKELNDQFMCNVFGRLKDNISSYGEPKEYAPRLNIQQLELIRDKKDLDQLTSSIAISLARSDEAVRNYYQKIFKKMKLPSVITKGVQSFYPVNDLHQYIRADHFPISVVSIQRNALYSDISLSKESRRHNVHISKYEIFDVIGIEWLKNGVPRLVTNYGYVTANRDWVLPLNEAEGIYVRINEFGKYEAIEQSKEVKDKVFNKLINMIERPYKIFNKDADFEHIEKKWNKFTRDPYQFFADAKNDKLVIVKHLFDEDQKIGNTLSNWIRKNL